MTNLTAAITYYLSAKGQKASLLAGGSGAEKQTITGEIQPEDIDLFAVDNAGNLSADAKYGSEIQSYYGPSSINFEVRKFDTPQTIESLVGFLLGLAPRRAEATRNAHEKWLNEKIDYFLNLAANNDSSYGNDRDGGIYIGSTVISPDHPRFEEVRAARDARSERLETARQEREAKDAEEKARREDRERQDREREEQKAAFLRAWVLEHGDENQRERLQAGMLPDSEILPLIETEAFAPLAGFNTYEKITADDVRYTCAGECVCNGEYREDSCSVDFESGAQGEATAEEWEQMKKIRKLIPTAEVSLRWHQGYCDDDDCAAPHGLVELHGIYVKLPVGPFVFNREYSIE